MNDALDKAEEFMDERQEKAEDVPDSKGVAKKVGGLGLGTAFTLYVAYKFIFK